MGYFINDDHDICYVTDRPFYYLYVVYIKESQIAEWKN
jgi:hypothetical protein